MAISTVFCHIKSYMCHFQQGLSRSLLIHKCYTGKEYSLTVIRHFSKYYCDGISLREVGRLLSKQHRGRVQVSICITMICVYPLSPTNPPSPPSSSCSMESFQCCVQDHTENLNPLFAHLISSVIPYSLLQAWFVMYHHWKLGRIWFGIKAKFACLIPEKWLFVSYLLKVFKAVHFKHSMWVYLIFETASCYQQGQGHRVQLFKENLPSTYSEVLNFLRPNMACQHIIKYKNVICKVYFVTF